MIRENASWTTSEPNFYSSKDLRGIINPDLILVSSIDTPRLNLGINLRLKRIFDIIFSILIIICILTWLSPLLALAVKVSSKGPVFFLQKRNKKNGKIFTCIKFRSMIVNEEADLIQILKDDTHITYPGKFLRKYHIDELPQFINVLLGDMSVVGPRPHMISDNLHYNKLIDHYSNRSTVKPGITGLAQVMGFNGRITNINTMKNRVKMDNFYIRHWSFLLDIKIIFLTIANIFKKQKCFYQD